jgi:hypothetical protein
MKDKNNRRLARHVLSNREFFKMYGYSIFKHRLIYNKDKGKNTDEITDKYRYYEYRIGKKEEPYAEETLKLVDNILDPEYKKSRDYFLGAYISIGFLIVYIILLFIIIPMLNIPNNSVLIIPIIITIALIFIYPLAKIAVSAYPFYAWKKTRSNNNKTE